MFNVRINEPQLWRLVIIALFAFFVSIFAPEVAFGEIAQLTDPANVIVIFVFVTGFLISQAIIRNRELDSAVSVEVSRLRRSVHLVENMSLPVAHKRELRRTVVTYFREVATLKHFERYDAAHGKLKDFTRPIYAMKPKGARELTVYKELLEVTRDAAYQRQQVAHRLRSFANTYMWIISILLASISVIALLASREPHFTSQLFLAGSIAGVLLVLDLLYEQDVLTRSRGRWYQARYAASAKALREEYGD